MKIMNNKWIQKITIMLVALILFNFTVPNVSNASIGSLMLKPVKGLIVTIVDAVYVLVERTIFGWDTENFSFDKLETEIKSVGGERDFDNGVIEIPQIRVSPEEIFLNKVESLNANFFREIKDDAEAKGEGKIVSDQKSLQNLQQLISNWYKALRYIAVIGLMCVLVYVGIRMVLSATAGDKAKYKKMLMDWIVALCLIFFMHYIMSFAMTLADNITSFFASGTNNMKVGLMQGDEFVNAPKPEDREGLAKNEVRNIVEFVRVYVHLSDYKYAFLYLILYVVLIGYTFYFTFIYLKRFLYMAFLTLIAPMVALTYPIDKIGDGQAQAFNMWLKEYMYNALLQPFHALIYRIFVLMSLNLAGTNLLYTCVAIGFLIPAEKFLKKMFGFDKATTASPLGAVATGAAMNKLMSNIKSKSADHSKGSGNSSGSSGSSDQVRFKAQSNGYDAFGGKLPAGSNVPEEQGSNTPDPNRGTGGQGSNIPDPNRGTGGQGSNTPDPNQTAVNQDSDITETKQRIGKSDSEQEENNEQTGDNSSNSNGNKPNNDVKERLITDKEPSLENPRTFKETMGAMGRKGFKDFKDNVKPRTLWNKRGKAGKWVRKAAGVATGAVGAAALGTIGLAAGIATGDPSKAFSLAGAGIAAGFASGRKVANTVADGAASVAKPIQNRYRDAKYGVNGANELAAKKKFLNDEKNVERYRQHFADHGERLNSAEINEKMQQAWEYKRYGLTDEQALDAMEFNEKVLQTSPKYNKLTNEQKISMAAKASELSSTITESELSDEKKLKSRRNGLLTAMNGDETKVDNLLSTMGDFHYMKNKDYKIGTYDPKKVLNIPEKPKDKTKEETKENPIKPNPIKPVQPKPVQPKKEDTKEEKLMNRLTEASHNGQMDG